MRARLSSSRVSVGAYPEAGRVVFFLFLGFIVYRYLQVGERVPVLGALRVEFFVGAILSCVAIIRLMSRKARESSSVPIWAVLLFLLMAISVTYSVAPAVSWNAFVERVVKFAMPGICIAAFVTSPSTLRWFMGAYLLAFLKMAQEGVLGTITGNMIWENQGTPRLHGSTPIYFSPNSLSGTQLSTLPFIYELYQVVPRLFKYILIAQAIGALTVVLYTGSRTGYVAVIVWMIMMLSLSKHKWRAAAVLSVVAIVGWMALPQEYKSRFETIITQEDAEGASIDTRKQILIDAWQVTLENPLGIGIAAFPALRTAQFGRSQDTHNLYLEVTTNLGWLGLVLFMGLVIAMLRQLMRIARSMEFQRNLLEERGGVVSQSILKEGVRSHLADLRVIEAVARATFVFLIIRLGLGMFGHDLLEIYWWFALGLSLALANIEMDASAETKRLLEMDIQGNALQLRKLSNLKRQRYRISSVTRTPNNASG